MDRRSARTRAGGISVLVLGALLALGACGGSGGGGGASGGTSSSPAVGPTSGDLNPNSDAVDILAAADVALRAATSFDFDAKTVSADDGSTGETDVQVDSGGHAVGRITSAGGQILLRVADGVVYVKGPAAFYTSQFSLPDSSVALTLNKWVAAALTDTTFGTFSSSSTIDGIADSLFNNVSSATLYTTATANINGVKAVGVTDGQGTVLYVSLKGEPYPLSLQTNPAAVGATGNTGSVTLSKFGQKFTTDIPPADQVVQWSSLPKS
jgi:hypothetical protein